MKKIGKNWRKATEEELQNGSPEMILVNEFEYEYDLNLEVDSWKLKAILSQMDLTTNIINGINSLSEPQKTYALLAWDNSPTIRSSSTTAKFIQGVLKLTDEQVEQIFINASNIDV